MSDQGRSGIRRRLLLKSSAIGLGLAALRVAPAEAAFDPIPGRIEKSGIAVELVDFAAPPRTSAKRPYAHLNTLFHAGDGTRRLFTNDARGKLWQIDAKTGTARLVLDVAAARAGRFVQDTSQMGLRSFAFHPDFGKADRPGHLKLYTLVTEAVAAPAPGAPLFDGPFQAIFHDVLLEWTARSAGALTVDPGSARELLRIAQYKTDHNADQVVFNLKAKSPDHPDYGKLYFGVGDGGNVLSHSDPFDQAQDGGQALGKIFRIDPLEQPDGSPYGIPKDNPFIGRKGYLGEVWALGLRHPQNISFDLQGSRDLMLISDIGQSQIEEINIGRKGANYGWPAREGTFVTDRLNAQVLYPRPADDATYGYTYPVAQYDHGEGRAVTGGYVYHNGPVKALRGHYLFGDIVSGRVFHVPYWKLWNGQQATVRELTLKRGGAETTLLGLVGAPSRRVDLRFGQDERGEVYLLTKQDGKIRKMRPA